MKNSGELILVAGVAVAGVVALWAYNEAKGVVNSVGDTLDSVGQDINTAEQTGSTVGAVLLGPLYWLVSGNNPFSSSANN